MANGEPPWYAGCIANIQKLGGTKCSQDHCDSNLIKTYTHAFCFCQDPYLNGCKPPNNTKPDCCSYDGESPVPVYSLDCYCCCSCMADNTPVAYDATSYKAIEEFQVNDLVYVADDVSLGTWSQQRVLFSSGAGGPGSSNTMLKVTYRTADSSDYLLVNRAQLFLTPDRQLKTAATLVPGKDSLVTNAGEARPVLSLEVGEYKRGLHHIATSTSPASSPNRHLILAKDIVCGDWALQVALSTSNAANLPLVADHASLPQFGTAAYQSAHPQVEHTPFAATVAGVQHAQPDVGEFAAFSQSAAVYIPENAHSFLTSDQAWEILGTPGAIDPPTSTAGAELLRYLFTLFQAFHPDVHFFLDNRNQTPNAHFFTEYGQKTVVVTGGLIRAKAVGLEAMALVIAQAVAASIGSAPLDEYGNSCAAAADYGAIAGVIPTVWIGLQSGRIIRSGIAQVTGLFSAITKYRAGTSVCHPSLDCRLQTMQAALDLLPLPNCAGGPPDPALAVSGAEGVVGTPHGRVTVSFSLPVDPATAQALGNYAFEPIVDSYSATLSDDDPTSVIVEADLASGTEYTLSVADVLSVEQQPLMSGQDSATFKTA